MEGRKGDTCFINSNVRYELEVNAIYSVTITNALSEDLDIIQIVAIELAENNLI